MIDDKFRIIFYVVFYHSYRRLIQYSDCWLDSLQNHLSKVQTNDSNGWHFFPVVVCVCVCKCVCLSRSFLICTQHFIHFAEKFADLFVYWISEHPYRDISHSLLRIPITLLLLRIFKWNAESNLVFGVFFSRRALIFHQKKKKIIIILCWYRFGVCVKWSVESMVLNCVLVITKQRNHFIVSFICHRVGF